MAARAHLKTRITDRVIDDGGTVLDEKTVTYVVEHERDFFMTYCKVLGLLKDMKLAEIKTLAWLVSNSHFNNNRVVVTNSVRGLIAEEMGISPSSVNNALKPLMEKGVLYRGEKGGVSGGKKRDGVYYIHPEYYWKGSLAERKKALRIALEMGA